MQHKIVILLLFVQFSFSQQFLPDWESGMLEFHHINTGRGDAAFVIFPDGTTLLIDAGDTSDTHPRTVSNRNEPRRPNAKRTPSEWIIDYIRAFHPRPENLELDYAFITHFHDDHFGEVDSLRIRSKKGDYLLTGISGIGDSIPINVLLDRGDTFPVALKGKAFREAHLSDEFKLVQTLENYWRFIKVQKKSGLTHQPLIVGRLNQIHLQHDPDSYPEFSIRNLAASGWIWTGEKENMISLYKTGDYPGENNLSGAIKISFGLFDYLTAGDISGVNAMGATDFNSIESHIAAVAGPVDVATLNHHGNRDSQNAYYVRSIRPRVWIQQNWSSDHPGDEVLRRILSKDVYPGERDVFSTGMLAANKAVIGKRLDAYKSQQGHIVLRVFDHGTRYNIYVLNDKNLKREILKKFGPYESR